MSDEEADRQRSENEARADQGDDAAGETKERYSRFGDWFDVLSK